MDKTEKIAEIFKALSDPTRLRLIQLLSKCQTENAIAGVCEGGPLCVNALANKLGVSQSAVSQHLRVLRQAVSFVALGERILCTTRLIRLDLRNGRQVSSKRLVRS